MSKGRSGKLNFIGAQTYQIGMKPIGIKPIAAKPIGIKSIASYNKIALVQNFTRHLMGTFFLRDVLSSYPC